jgi:signal transduction histidine kinase
LRTRVFAILSVFVLIVLSGGSFLIWYTFQMENLVSALVDEEVTALQEVGNLERDLANQKGFVSYYFIDHDPAWLKQLDKYRQSFRERLSAIRDSALFDEDRTLIEKIESRYNEYVATKDKVITLYKTGKEELGNELHQVARIRFFDLLQLCQQYSALHQERIQEAQIKSRQRARHLRVIAVSTMSVAVFLGAFLAVILVRQILGPVRRLAMETDRSGGTDRPGDEVVALSHQVRTLIKDMEKFALVGKLAAGVAHSIRNPLTSVKMRLFSMERSLELTATQQEDFQVISEEIRHIDTIVGNFLEFSRPPKLTMQAISPSEVVDNALQLLRHRLESFNVTVALKRQKPLPLVSADPEQLKEVLVNLLVNACEAMPHGGAVVITERESTDKNSSASAMVEISDNGPGIPQNLQIKVFQPFFSTKEEGTGLGLAIAGRIVNEHGGRLDLRSREGKGTTFIIHLPLQKTHEHNSTG